MREVHFCHGTWIFYPDIASLQVADGGGGLEIQRVGANILKKGTGQPTDVILRVGVFVRTRRAVIIYQTEIRTSKNPL